MAVEINARSSAIASHLLIWWLIRKFSSAKLTVSTCDLKLNMSKYVIVTLIIDEKLWKFFYIFPFFLDAERLDKTILFCTFNLFNMQNKKREKEAQKHNRTQRKGILFFSFGTVAAPAVKFVELFTHVIVKAYPRCSCKCFFAPYSLRILPSSDNPCMRMRKYKTKDGGREIIKCVRKVFRFY